MMPALTMKLLLLLLTVAVIISWYIDPTSRPETCNDGQAHQWGQWSDEWERAGASGSMKQVRHCEKCGVAQVGYHK